MLLRCTEYRGKWGYLCVRRLFSQLRGRASLKALGGVAP